MRLYCDNQIIIHIAEMYHEGTKT